MLIRKASLLLGIAVLALAGSASEAAAAEWKDGGLPLLSGAEAEFSGVVGFASELGSYKCPAQMPISLEPGGGGSLTGFEMSGIRCKGTGIFEESCTPGTPEVTYEPREYTLTVIGGTQVLDLREEGTLDIHFPVAGECGVEKITYTVGELHLTAPYEGPIEEVTLTGAATLDVPGLGKFASEAFGAMEMLPFGTYEVG